MSREREDTDSEASSLAWKYRQQKWMKGERSQLVQKANMSWSSFSMCVSMGMDASIYTEFRVWI